MNAETFGASGRRGRGRGRFRGRGRGGGYGGRGYYRGGRGGRYRDDSQSSRDGSNDGEAGHGGRGRRGGRSRGSRGGRQARQWVDYPLDAEMERLQKNVQNGSNVVSLELQQWACFPIMDCIWPHSFYGRHKFFYTEFYGRIWGIILVGYPKMMILPNLAIFYMGWDYSMASKIFHLTVTIIIAVVTLGPLTMGFCTFTTGNIFSVCDRNFPS